MVYSQSAVNGVIVRKTRYSFIQYLVCDLFTHSSHSWVCYSLFLQLRRILNVCTSLLCAAHLPWDPSIFKKLLRVFWVLSVSHTLEISFIDHIFLCHILYRSNPWITELIYPTLIVWRFTPSHVTYPPCTN